MSAKVSVAIKRARYQRTVNCRHDEANLHGVGGTGEVGVYLLRLMLIEGNESVQDVVTGGLIIGTTWIALASFSPNESKHTFIVREVILHGTDGQLLLEAIDFIQEQDDGGLDEPPRVADGIE